MKAESWGFLPLKLVVKIHKNIKFFKYLVLIFPLFTFKSIFGLISEINHCRYIILLLQLILQGNPTPHR